MRIRAAALTFALFAVLFSPADAADGRSCGGSYFKTGACPKDGESKMVLRGTPITVFGDSLGSSAFVRVGIGIDGWPEIPPVWLCEGRGSGYASCDADYPDAFTTLQVPPTLASVRVTCHVQGSGSGIFQCRFGPRE